MNPIFKAARVSMVALPLAIVGGVATAGGLADPIPTPAPVPAPAPAPAPVVVGDWTGFYGGAQLGYAEICLLYTSPSPRDKRQSRMPSSA